MTTKLATFKVNLGCGKFPLEGYRNYDQHEMGPMITNADVWDLSLSEVDEVRMDHFLEHFSHRDTWALLSMVHGWLKPTGRLVVEVPDMQAIMSAGPEGDWLRYVYGSQQHEGEFHRTGFTARSLQKVLNKAGFQVAIVSILISDFPTRIGMPCLLGQARA